MEMKVHCIISTTLHSLLKGCKTLPQAECPVCLCVCVRACVCAASYVQELLRCVWRHLVGVLKGESPTLCHTSSLLHTLGSVTVSMAGVDGGGACAIFYH